MKEIALTQGKVAVVDNEDFAELNKFKWHAIKMGNAYYAVRSKKAQMILMHRVILGAVLKQQIDHRDHNGLNNQRDNIRLCSRAQNGMNRRKQKNTSSQYKGVCWDKQNKKWVAYIYYQGKGIHLGYFREEKDAARTYDNRAKELFGEFAETNFKEFL